MTSLDIDTTGWDWGHSDYSAAAVGDSGPWVWWLPLAWRAVADPLGDHPLPPAPRPFLPDEVGRPDKHAAIIAWWSPLLHLLFFGSGWVRPDLGLARWLDLGQPDHDPVLRLVKRWWGTQVVDMLAWAGREDALRSIAAEINSTVHTTSEPVRLPDRWADRRASAEWKGTWGADHDAMHLSYHVIIPVSKIRDDHARLVTSPVSGGPPRAVLMLSTYEGWYATLNAMGSALPIRPDGHAWQVDVIIRQLGWLGNYRRSRLTGRWFSGWHRWHQLGIDAPLDV